MDTESEQAKCSECEGAGYVLRRDHTLWVRAHVMRMHRKTCTECKGTGLAPNSEEER